MPDEMLRSIDAGTDGARRPILSFMRTPRRLSGAGSELRDSKTRIHKEWGAHLPGFTPDLEIP